MYYRKISERDNNDAQIYDFSIRNPEGFRWQTRHWLALLATVVGLGVVGCNAFFSKADSVLAGLEDDYSDCVRGADNPTVRAGCSEVVAPPSSSNDGTQIP